MASYRLAVRRDTAANWTSADPILAQGEFGYEFDTLLLKIGDGTTAWTALGYYDPNPALGTGGSLVGAFKYDDTTGAPGAGRFTFDSTTPASVTELQLSVISLNDFVWTGIADRILPIGAQFVAIQQNDSSKWIHVEVTSTGTDNVSYWTYDVTFVAEGPGGMPLNGKECVIEIVQPQRADIEDLDNVTVTLPTVGQILEWNGTEWVNVDQLASYGNAEVDINLNTASALTNEVLQWDGLDYKWTPLPVDTDTDALVDLTDTTIATPVNGEILQYNGSVWVNAAAPVTYGDADVDTHLNTSTASVGNVLEWDGSDYTWAAPSGGGAPATGPLPEILLKGDVSVTQDDSLNGYTFTTTGTAPTVNTSDKQFGAGSMSFPTTTKITTNETVNFGTQSFCIEAWLKPTSLVGTEYWGSKTTTGAFCWLPIANGIPAIMYAGAARSATSSLSTSAWNHVAFVYDGTKIRVYFNGTQEHSATANSDLGDQVWTFGGTDSGVSASSNWYDGLIDDLRVTVGDPVYSANFTPAEHSIPVPKPLGEDETDVIITSPSSGEVLEYNGTSWVNAPAGGGGLTTTQSTPVAGDIGTLENLDPDVGLNTKGVGAGYFVGPNNTENDGFSTNYRLNGGGVASLPYHGGVVHYPGVKTLVGGRNGAGLSCNGTDLSIDQMGFGFYTTSGTAKFRVTTGGAVTINDAFTFPTADGTSGQTLETDGAGNVTWATASGGGGSSTLDGLTDVDFDTIAVKTGFETGEVVPAGGNGNGGIKTDQFYSGTQSYGWTNGASGGGDASSFSHGFPSSSVKYDYISLRFRGTDAFTTTNRIALAAKGDTFDVITSPDWFLYTRDSGFGFYSGNGFTEFGTKPTLAADTWHSAVLQIEWGNGRELSPTDISIWINGAFAGNSTTLNRNPGPAVGNKAGLPSVNASTGSHWIDDYRVAQSDTKLFGSTQATLTMAAAEAAIDGVGRPLSAGDALVYIPNNGWVNSDSVEVGAIDLEIGDLTDVSNNTFLTVGDVLAWDGFSWANTRGQFSVNTVSGNTTIGGNLTTEGSVVMMTNLPTADPVNAGQLWNDAGTLKVSAG